MDRFPNEYGYSPTMEWISAEDRLPGTRDNVLVYVSDIRKIYMAFYFDGVWRQYATPYIGVDTVTHWMPLPEPPKPKEPTFKDVFLNKFPKTKLLDGGTPVVCAKGVFPQIEDFDDCCNGICRECWNHPYFEEAVKRMRLIDADALSPKWQDVLKEKADEKDSIAYQTFELFIDRLKNEPTIEAEPVRHGEWVPIYQTLYNKHGASQIATEWSCSQCGCLLTDRRNYCPNCGAKMDGGKRE